MVEARTRKAGHEDPRTLCELRNLAVIRRDQGESAKARALLARLGEDARRALDSGKTRDPAEALDLRRYIAISEVVGRNLVRPERSEAAPGRQAVRRGSTHHTGLSRRSPTAGSARASMAKAADSPSTSPTTATLADPTSSMKRPARPRTHPT